MLLCSLAAFFLLISDSPARAGDWNQWRGGSRNGVDDGPALIEKLPADGLTPVWMSGKIEGGGSGGWACPVVAEGRVYLFTHIHSSRPGVKLPPEQFPSLKDADREKLSKADLKAYEKDREAEQRERRRISTRYDEVVQCFDAAGGKLLWKTTRESVPTNFPVSGTPAVVEGRVTWLGADRVVRCIDAAKGEDLWNTPLPVKQNDEAIQSSVAVADGVAIVLADHLFGLDAKSGEVLWEADADETRGSDTSPVIWRHQGKTYAIANVCDRETVCLDAKDGREVWRVRGEAHRSTPVIAGDKLITYGNSRGKGLRCFLLSADEPKPLWVCQKIYDEGASPVVVGDRVYATGDKRMACIALDSGEVLWERPLTLNNPKYTSLAASKDAVLYAFEHVMLVGNEGPECSLRFDAQIDDTGRLAELSYFRRALKLDDVERMPEGARKSEELLRRRLGPNEPLECCSPALSDGRLYLRLKNALVCYDLRR
jgi:outer membrane protein assembly factor BamB